MIGDDVVVTVVEMRGEVARIGIAAPRHVRVHREEVYKEVAAANAQAASATDEDAHRLAALVAAARAGRDSSDKAVSTEAAGPKDSGDRVTGALDTDGKDAPTAGSDATVTAEGAATQCAATSKDDNKATVSDQGTSTQSKDTRAVGPQGSTTKTERESRASATAGESRPPADGQKLDEKRAAQAAAAVKPRPRSVPKPGPPAIPGQQNGSPTDKPATDKPVTDKPASA